MKKILMLAAAVAMLASCTNDATTDELLVNGAEQVGTWNGEGLIVEASAEDVTRVNTNVNGNTSYLTWEVGDELTLVHGGASYVYLAQQEGRVSTFVPKDDANAITSVDPTLPVAAFYNVTSVDPATLKATFAVAAEQTEGELTNKLPLYGYAATTVVEGGKVVVTMKPLASVVEFELSASNSWNADAFSLGVSSRQLNTYASAEGLVVDAATGAVDLSTATLGNTILVNLSAMHDFATKRNVSVVVPGVSNSATTIVGEGDAAEEVTTYTVPVYKGKACVKLYKEGKENFRRTIWNTYTVDNTVAVDERKHVYQPLKDILDGHMDGIRTVEDLWAFRNEYQTSCETYPVGARFCDEDGVVRLHADLKVEDWKYIGNTGADDGLVNLRWRGLFDGQGHTVEYTMEYSWDNQAWSYVDAYGETRTASTATAGFFNTICGGYIKNLTVKGSAHITFRQPESLNPSQDHWTYFGAVVGQIHGGSVENCHSYVNIDCTDHYSGKFRIGGITGRMMASEEDGEIIDCTNHGNIDLRLKAAEKPLQFIPGGLVGLIGDDANGCFPYMENCKNYGNIYVGGSDFVGNHFVGGCIGVATCKQGQAYDLVELYNYGEVKSFCKPTGKQVMYIGGIVSRLQYANLIDCVNGDEKDPTKGVVSDVVFNPCAAITYMGGVVGNIDAGTTTTMDTCINYAPITTNAPANTCIGGVIGIQTVTSQICYCENYGTVTINVPETCTSATFGGGVAGKMGTSKAADRDKYITDCANYGDVIVYAPAPMGNYFAGVLGAAYGGTGAADKTAPGGYVDSCINEGNIIVLENGGSGLYNRIAGCVGLCNSVSVKNCENYGNVEIYSARGQNNSYGGVVGYDNQSAFAHEFTGNVNEGTVAVFCNPTPDRATYTKDKWLAVGGVIGQINASNAAGAVHVSENENYGVVAANIGDLVEANKEYFHIASVVGWWQNITVCKTFKDNVVGGEIGTTTLDGHVAYDPANPDAYTPGTITSTELNETADSDYYWEKWLYSQVGETAKKPDTSGNTFGN